MAWTRHWPDMSCPNSLVHHSILLCVWVYRDAESRGMGGVLWLIVVILTGIIGLIIYLIVRKPEISSS